MHLNDKTTIPLWSVISALPVIVGFVIWLSVIANTTNANAHDIKDLIVEKEKQSEVLMKIKEDVAFIRGKLEPQTTRR